MKGIGSVGLCRRTILRIGEQQRIVLGRKHKLHWVKRTKLLSRNKSLIFTFQAEGIDI